MIETRDITHFPLFCGLCGGPKGFNRGQARFHCLGGIDVDPAAIRDFTQIVAA